MRTEAPEETPAAPPKEGRRQRRGRGSSGEGRFGQRILPRTVIGVVVLMLAAAIGFAFGGTVPYADYQYRTDKLEKKVDKFVGRREVLPGGLADGGESRHAQARPGHRAPQGERPHRRHPVDVARGT